MFLFFYLEVSLLNRVILHSDMNNFYASVECMLNPELRGKAVAVCGSQEERHGIVLAKNYAAKAFGVTTGEAVWQAKQKCRDLIIVPPQYEQYIKFSKLAREIYSRYTDIIEPFGMDECWLDVTGSTRLFGNGEMIANKIRETFKFELGLTVSVGVSFNKIFAKLGSDMRKPDAVTCITKNDFRDIVWKLPASDMLGVGKRTEEKLKRYGIYTIGQLADTDVDFLKSVFKSYGSMLWLYANGYDNSLVCKDGYKAPIKSIGHGITTKRDLEKESEVWPVILELSQDIGHKLRANCLLATGVAVCVRDNELITKMWQTKLPMSTQSESYIAKIAYKLFLESYIWKNDIRSITVRAIDLIPVDTPLQLDLFNDRTKLDKMETIDSVVDTIRQRFGKTAVCNASLLMLNSLPVEKSKDIRMPTGINNCR